MISVLRQNVVVPLCLRNSAFLAKSHWAFENHVPLLHFSTSVEGEGERRSTFYELLHRHHFSPPSASQLASVMMRLRSPQRADSVLSFLKECGFSNSQLEKMVLARPRLLSGDLERYIKPKIRAFQDVGLSLADVVQILTNEPSIFSHSVKNRLVPSLSSLKKLVGDDQLPGLLKASGYLAGRNLGMSLFPNVELLSKCGVSMHQIIKTMHHQPRFLFRRVELTKKSVARAEEMGVRRGSRVFLDAVRIISSFPDNKWQLKLRALRQLGFMHDDIASAFRIFPNLFCLSMETLKLKIRTLQEIGFSDDDTAAILRKYPEVYCLSRERIKEVVEVLVANGRYDISCIISFPPSLLSSIEKRYKPRLRVLELLEDKKLIKRWPALSTLRRMTDEKFNEKYVVPFLKEIWRRLFVKRYWQCEICGEIIECRNVCIQWLVSCQISTHFCREMGNTISCFSLVFVGL